MHCFLGSSTCSGSFGIFVLRLPANLKIEFGDFLGDQAWQRPYPESYLEAELGSSHRSIVIFGGFARMSRLYDVEDDVFRAFPI